MKEHFPLSLRWLIFRRIPNLLTIFKPNTPHGERGEIVGLSMIGQVTGNKREFIYSPLQLRVRSRSELQKSLSLGNESNTWNTQQKPPPKEKRDGMKRKLPALCSGTHDISISWLMPVAFEHTQTEVKRYFSWLRILFYMKNKVIKYIKFCCCSCQEPLSMLCNFGS